MSSSQQQQQLLQQQQQQQYLELQYQQQLQQSQTDHQFQTHHLQQHQHEDEEEEEEDKRESLYMIMHALREEGEYTPVSRLLYTAYLSESAVQQQNLDLEQIMQEKTKDPEDKDHEILQGYLLIKGQFMIHLLEGESSLLNNFLTDLYKEVKKDKSIYQAVNVIAFNEENLKKCFAKWYCDNIYQAGPTLSQDIDKTEKQAQDRSWEIYNQICQAGKNHPTKDKKEKLTKKLASEITISTDDMSLLMSKNFMSLVDYYMLYLSDVEIQLDGELQYPFQPSLTQTLEYATKGTLETY